MTYPIDLLSKIRARYLEEDIPYEWEGYQKGRWNLSSTINSVVRAYGKVALVDYVLDKNIDSFWGYYHQGAELMHDLLKQWQAGETNLNFERIDMEITGIIEALMVGDASLASAIAAITDTTLMPENRPEKHKRINKSHYNYYKLIRAIQEGDQTPEAIEGFITGINKEVKSGPGAGMIGSFRGIALKDQTIFDDGIEKMHKTHAVRTRPNQFYSSQPEYYLCPWGVRNAVLGVRAGLEFRLESKWIPQDLVLGLAERNPETQK